MYKGVSVTQTLYSIYLWHYENLSLLLDILLNDNTTLRFAYLREEISNSCLVCLFLVTFPRFLKITAKLFNIGKFLLIFYCCISITAWLFIVVIFSIIIISITIVIIIINIFIWHKSFGIYFNEHKIHLAKMSFDMKFI